MNNEQLTVNNELKSAAELALDELAKLGADGAEVSLSKSRMDELNVDAGEFSLMRTTFDSGLSIRALVGGRKGSAGANSIDAETLAKAAKTAVGSAQSSEPDDAEIIAPSLGEREFSNGIGEIELDKLYDRIDEFMKTVKTEYPKVDIMQLIAKVNTGYSLYANSNGSRVFQKNGYYTFSVTFSGRDGDKTSSMSGYGFALKDLGMPFIEIAEMRRMLREIELQIDTVPVAGKFVGKLLVAPDCFAEFLGEALRNCVSDSVIIAGDSPWKDKLGEAVADSALSVSSDPLNASMVGRSAITSDGYIAERQDVISGGVLTGFLLSQYGAKKTGHERAKSYGGAMVVAPGDMSFAEMLASVGEGLLINRFSGGSPASNGEFSGVAKNSFLIKDGKITDAVSETMISGNLLEMLGNVKGISSELVSDGGMVMPWILFDGVTISGK